MVPFERGRIVSQGILSLPFHDFEHGVFADVEIARWRAAQERHQSLEGRVPTRGCHHARPAGMRYLTLRAVIGSVVDRLQADVILRGSLPAGMP